MKNTKYDYKLIFLSTTLFLLVLIFLLNSIFTNKIQKRTVINSAILNSKYNVKKFEIRDSNNSLNSIYKVDSFWGGQITKNDSTTYFPVDEKTVIDFLTLSKEIRTLNKIVDNSKNISSESIHQNYLTYGLSDESAIVISYFDSTNACVSKIYFGSLNQTLDQIFLRTEKNSTIYSMDSKIIDYLEVKPNFWCDKNILPIWISKNIDSTDIQNISFNLNNSKFINANKKAFDKFPSLRFSELIYDSNQILNSEKDSLLIKITTGKGSEYNLNFIPAQTINGKCSLFELKIIPDITYSQKEIDFIKKLNYKATVSNWTFNSIKEMLE